MQVLCGPVAALAIASIYYAYRAFTESQVKRKRALHERVAFMIWSAAQKID